MDESKRLSRRKFVTRAALGGLALAGGGAAYSLLRKAPGPVYPPGLRGTVGPLPGFTGRRPNIVLIVTDDLGWGDLSCSGSRAIRTPNMDRLAVEGMRFTDFHACDAVCTPSRAGLLTGRYPARMGLDTPLQALGEPLGKRAVVRLGYLMGRIGLLDLAARGGGEGLPEAEITLAEALRSGGYRTGMVGKWHLGDYSADPRFNPLRHGFDFQFGVPYSNDMRPLPLFRNEEKLETDVADLSRLTGVYTEEALGFLETGGDRPFFLYFAHTFPHRPLAVSEAFAGRSAAGLYGDVVGEVDDSVGQILDALQAKGIAENTLVFFTSENGPWYDGSPGPYRGRKGQAFEGGHRIPFLARAPGLIQPGSVCHSPATHLDLFPTCLAAAGLAPPVDRALDGLDITTLLAGSADASPHEYLYLYHQGELEGIRWGDWKYLRSTNHYTWPMPVNKRLGSMTNHTTGPLPLLYDLSTDPGEAYNLAERFPDVAARLDAAMTAWEAEMAANPLGLVGR
jgi:arylsulfatase A-like enzyme